MERYGAEIHDNIVVNVLVLEHGEKGDEAIEVLGLVEEPGVHPGIGWLWDGQRFIDPTFDEESS
jgi:hypothetical protein